MTSRDRRARGAPRLGRLGQHRDGDRAGLHAAALLVGRDALPAVAARLVAKGGGARAGDAEDDQAARRSTTRAKVRLGARAAIERELLIDQSLASSPPSAARISTMTDMASSKRSGLVTIRMRRRTRFAAKCADGEEAAAVANTNMTVDSVGGPPRRCKACRELTAHGATHMLPALGGPSNGRASDEGEGDSGVAAVADQNRLSRRAAAGAGALAGGPVAAGCVFWDRAMEGKSFYTLPSDHWNCAVGSHTHKIGLPADRGNELSATIGFMVETRYLDAAEVPGIPTLDREPAAVAYAPAASDAVQGRRGAAGGDPAQSTLVFEAALKAGIARGSADATSRPSCASCPRREDRAHRALVRLQRQPDVHDRRRRRDVPGGSRRPLGRACDPPDRGAALEPDDGQLLPGAGGEVLRAQVAAARRATEVGEPARVLSAEAVRAARARRALLAGRPGARRAPRSAAARELARGRLRRRHDAGWRARHARAARPRRAVLAGRAHGHRAGDRLPPPGRRDRRRSPATRAAATTTTRTATG